MSYTFNPTASEASLLNQIKANESSGNYTAVISPATCYQLTGRTDCTASGAYQFTNATWADATAATGVGTGYATAASAPADVQDINALWLLRARGTAPWASSGPYTPYTPADGALVDLSGSPAATPTSSILDQLSAQLTGAGVDLSSPGTALLVAAGLAAAVLVLTQG